MVMIRPLLMEICEVNDWGQPWEQIKDSPVQSWCFTSKWGSLCVACWSGAFCWVTIFRTQRKMAKCVDATLQWTKTRRLWRGASEKTAETNRLQLVFFIIATNWKTIHHINIIVVFQKMENKIKQHLYIFLPQYWTTLIFTCSDAIGFEIILWQYDCTIRRELNIYWKKTTPGCTLHHISQINNSFAFWHL